MSYISAENTKQIRNALKEVFKDTGIKFGVKKFGHSSVTVTLLEGPDFPTAREYCQKECSNGIGYYDVNPYWYRKNMLSIECDIMDKVIEVIKIGSSRKYFDKSDIQTDYFFKAFYFDITIGKFQKPYKCTNKMTLIEAVNKINNDVKYVADEDLQEAA